MNGYLYKSDFFRVSKESFWKNRNKSLLPLFKCFGRKEADLNLIDIEGDEPIDGDYKK
jgi:hypothetical protein